MWTNLTARLNSMHLQVRFFLFFYDTMTRFIKPFLKGTFNKKNKIVLKSVHLHQCQHFEFPLNAPRSPHCLLMHNECKSSLMLCAWQQIRALILKRSISAQGLVFISAQRHSTKFYLLKSQTLECYGKQQRLRRKALSLVSPPEETSRILGICFFFLNAKVRIFKADLNIFCYH